jgi:hypothetical protein
MEVAPRVVVVHGEVMEGRLRSVELDCVACGQNAVYGDYFEQPGGPPSDGGAQWQSRHPSSRAG